MATLTPVQLSTFLRQVGAMLDANVEVLRALRVAGQQSGSSELSAACHELDVLLTDGWDFSRALATRPDLFDAFCVEMARQGEEDGQLGKALIAAADYLDHAIVNDPTPQILVMQGKRRVRESAVVLASVGAAALGGGLCWAAAAALRSRRSNPSPWPAAAAAVWSGVCLVSGAMVLSEVPPPAPSTPRPLPPKSPERRAAETEAVVRNAILEQDDANAALPDFRPEP